MPISAKEAFERSNAVKTAAEKALLEEQKRREEEIAAARSRLFIGTLNQINVNAEYEIEEAIKNGRTRAVVEVVDASSASTPHIDAMEEVIREYRGRGYFADREIRDLGRQFHGQTDSIVKHVVIIDWSEAK